MFLDHTQRRSTVGRTPLDEWLARRRDLYLTTHNSHKTQTSMPPLGFEPTISAGEWPQTYALDRAAAGTGRWLYVNTYLFLTRSVQPIISILVHHYISKRSRYFWSTFRTVQVSYNTKLRSKCSMATFAVGLLCIVKATKLVHRFGC